MSQLPQLILKTEKSVLQIAKENFANSTCQLDFTSNFHFCEDVNTLTYDPNYEIV